MLTLIWVWALAAALVWIAWWSVRAEPAAERGARPSLDERNDGDEADDGPPVALMGRGRHPRQPGQGKGPTPLTKEHAAKLLFGRTKMFAVVWRWLARMSIPLHERDDLRQDTFANAWSSWHRYDPAKGRPEPWLNAIAFHIACRYHAAEWRKREELTPSPIDPRTPDASPDAVALLASEEDRLGVLDLLQQIDDVGLRTVLIAHDIDGIPMTEIAEQLGIPESTAYKWRVRALQAFADIARRTRQ